MTVANKLTDCPSCGSTLANGARFCGSCGNALSATEPATGVMSAVGASSGGDGSSDNIGKEISGRYRLLARLGEGGMGTVYRAEQISLKRKVAVKVLKPELSADPALVRRFNAEAELAARLNHPNTVTLYDFGQDDDGSLFIAMEFVEGDSLREIMVREGPMPTPRALHVCAQVCASIADAHSHGIIHRDLKPDNVMLTVRGKKKDVVRVLDFGIAKLRDAKGDITAMPMTQAGDLLGTPQYMAPEQIRGEKVDARTDVYAMGAMIYELITGRLPFEAPTLMAILSKHLTEMPVSPSDRRADLSIPPQLSTLVMSALAKNPDDRPSSMELVGDRLNEINATLGTGRPPSVGGEVHVPPGHVAVSKGMPSVVSPPPGVPRRLATPAPLPHLAHGGPPRAPIEDSLAASAESLARAGALGGHGLGNLPASAQSPSTAPSSRPPTAQPTPVPQTARTRGPIDPAARGRTSNGLMWAVLALLVIGAVGAAAFFALKKSSDETPAEKTDEPKKKMDDGEGDPVPSLHDWDVSSSAGGAGGAEAVAEGPSAFEQTRMRTWKHPDLPIRVRVPRDFNVERDGTMHVLTGTDRDQPLAVYVYGAMMTSAPNLDVQNNQLQTIITEKGAVVERTMMMKAGGENRLTAFYRSADAEAGQVMVFVKGSLLVLVGFGTTTTHLDHTQGLRKAFFNSHVLI